MKRPWRAGSNLYGWISSGLRSISDYEKAVAGGQISKDEVTGVKAQCENRR
jgi:hypothetical protein